MGSYVYGIAAPSKVFKANLHGEAVEVGLLKYVYKPWGGWDGAKKNAAIWARYGEPAVRAWAKSGKAKPLYFVPGFGEKHEIADGNPVLKWDEHRDAVCDDPNWGGLMVGVIRKVGAEYLIEPDEKFLAEILSSKGGV